MKSTKIMSMKMQNKRFNCPLFGVVVSETRRDAKGHVAGVALDVGLLSPLLGRAENTLSVVVVTVAGPV